LRCAAPYKNCHTKNQNQDYFLCKDQVYLQTFQFLVNDYANGLIVNIEQEPSDGPLEAQVTSEERKLQKDLHTDLLTYYTGEATKVKVLEKALGEEKKGKGQEKGKE